MQKKEIGSLKDCFVSENPAFAQEISWLMHSAEFNSLLEELGLTKSIMYSNLLDPSAEWGEHRIVQSFAVNRTYNLIDPLNFDPNNKNEIIEPFLKNIKKRFHHFFIEHGRDLLIGPEIHEFIEEDENKLYAITLMFGLSHDMLALYPDL